MSDSIRELEPKVMWNHFADLNSVPRPSKKEEKVRQFIIDFGNQLGLETKTDEVGNVFIKKPASKGMEDRTPIVLQSHLDMVCQKNNDTDFDFDTMGIQMYIDNDFVKAKGTTLGADNGIGVASIMAVLSSKDIQHPAVEALFTIDEETGMTGALGLKGGWLEGKILLNLDTEEDDELDIGCAGGVDVTGSGSYTPVANKYSQTYELVVSGLQGGHSGIDIHKGFGNANKLIARFLMQFKNVDFQLNEMNSGGLRNAIPREGKVTISCSEASKLNKLFESLKAEIIEEYKSLENNISITLSKVDLQANGMDVETQNRFSLVLQGLHNGVYRWSPDIENLVEASNNVANVIVKEGEVKILCLTRSSVDSTKDVVADSLQAVMELGGFEVSFSGAYPGWKPKNDSKILQVMSQLYKDLFQEEAKIVACHAGLECGILGTNYPQMDMISFGPNIFGAHSPDERVQISSVQKYWKLFIKTLEEIPAN